MDYKLQGITILMLLSTPLAINHWLLFGYADLWLAAAIVASVALSSLYLKSGSWKVLVLTLVSLLALMLVKNIGVIFSATIFAVAGIAYFRKNIPFIKVFFAALVGIVALVFSIDSGSPKVDSVFSVRFNEESLNFTKRGCTKAAFNEKFLIDIHPVDSSNLKTSRWVQARYPGRDFRTLKLSPDDVHIESVSCSFAVAIEGYKPKTIRVGQLSNSNHPSWMAILLPGAAYYEVPMLGISFQIGENVVVGAIGRYMILDINSPLDVFANAKTAFLDNASYSIFFSVLVLVTILSISRGVQFFSVEGFVLTVVWSLILLLLTVQVFVADFYSTSLPQNDTRYSRFMLWFPALVCLALYEPKLFGSHGELPIVPKNSIDN
ncbi:hypothetical protein DWB85_13935 [Seongchinamella sediminis]|uniref:Uncharacterized protein n=1 Tax=Seongchinamella sediminis TaxID=2283635 RepID=A0A3L7DUC8_9GAMM|nr:hypothetical protein DWB85_13935 [Seongchinamella sediminis]